jgi:hypothetical protein
MIARRFTLVPLMAALCALGAILALPTASALAAPPATPTTYLPAATTATTAILQGVLDESVGAFPVEAGVYEFLYKATKVASIAECESGSASKAPVPPGLYLGLGPERVFQEVTGLSSNTEYIACLVAENGKGEKAVGEPTQFDTAPEAPETQPATEVKATSARLEGVLQPGGTKLQYEFAYNQGASCTGGEATPLAEGEGAVSTVVEGLTPDVKYTFCLVARGLGGETAGESKSFETLPAPPAVTEEFASSVGAVNATFNATVNPDGLASTYRFEYGTSESYGASIPVPDGFISAGVDDVNVNVLVEGLEAGTIYHYRLLAHNSLGVVKGPDHTFTTQVATTEVTLPDDRAWEMVSPPAKQGVTLVAFDKEGGLIQAAEDGGALTYIAKAPIDANPAGNRTLALQQLLAERGADGWGTQDIATPNETVEGVKAGKVSEYMFFSSDLSVGLVEPEGATLLSPAASETTPYLREDGEYSPVVTGCPPAGAACEQSVEEHADVPPGTKFGNTYKLGQLLETGVKFAGATQDLRHIALTSNYSLASGFATDGNQALYEWNGGAPLLPVSILPDGSSAGIEGSSALGNSEQNTQVRNAISTNGNRIFFESRNGPSVRHLFMRDISREKTMPVDVPEGGAQGGGAAAYQDANSDGSEVFFTDTSPLTSGATDNNLYACEISESAGSLRCTLKDLTVSVNSGEHAEMLGAVIGASEDGSDVYFVANGVLTATGNANHEKAAPGANNLYVQHYDNQTGGWQPKFIATASSADEADWNAGVFHSKLSEVAARVSGNGRFLAFMSQVSLTGYDNRDAVSDAPDEEVFLYDAASGRLACASCDPTGARPVGVFDHAEGEQNAQGRLEVFLPMLVDYPELWAHHWLAGSIPGWIADEGGRAMYQSRYLDNDGRLFFNSPVGLVSQDANGREDVYEFEPDGVGSCSSTTSSGSDIYVGEVAGSPVDGCVGLISSGTSSEESAFLDASGNGSGGDEGEDVFFMTEAKLSSADVDSALDIYDAHVCTASLPCPSATTSLPPACTTAESCRAAPSQQPSIFGAPASATFSGAGNLINAPTKLVARKAKKTVRCAKSKKLSHGKCVKRRPNKRGKKSKASKSKAARRAGGERRVRS